MKKLLFAVIILSACKEQNDYSFSYSIDYEELDSIYTKKTTDSIHWAKHISYEKEKDCCCKDIQYVRVDTQGVILIQSGNNNIQKINIK